MTDGPKEQLWLKPVQTEQLREASKSDAFVSYLRERNEAIIAFMYDTGLRPSECCNVTTEMLDLDAKLLHLPSSAQKQYPTDSTPPPATIELGQDQWTGDTTLVLKEYLHDRWKDSLFLFPSKNSDSMKTRGLRRMVKKAAVEADVTPQKGFLKADGPEEMHPHALRHSVGYRLLSLRDDGTTMYDLKNRLRHQSLKTTEKHYDHFDTV